MPGNSEVQGGSSSADVLAPASVGSTANPPTPVQPLVTVVVTNYNYEQYLEQSLASVLAQTYPRIERVLIDDGSRDGSRAIYQQYADRFRIIEHESNRGIVATRNEALDLAQGEYLCFLDADDYWSDDYIEKMVGWAERTGAAVVYPNWRLFGEMEVLTGFPEFSPDLLQLQKINCTAESLLRLSAVRPFRFRSEDIAEDWDFFIRVSLSGLEFALAPDCRINYRIKRDSRGAVMRESDGVRKYVKILRDLRRERGLSEEPAGSVGGHDGDDGLGAPDAGAVGGQEQAVALIDPLELPLARLDERNAELADWRERWSQAVRAAQDLTGVTLSERRPDVLIKQLEIVQEQVDDVVAKREWERRQRNEVQDKLTKVLNSKWWRLGERLKTVRQALRLGQ